MDDMAELQTLLVAAYQEENVHRKNILLDAAIKLCRHCVNSVNEFKQEMVNQAYNTGVLDMPAPDTD